MRIKLIMGEECPQCDAIITLDEWQFERCGSCGYPDQIKDEELDDDFIDDDEGAYAEDHLEDHDDKDPNDSRNL